MAFLFITLGLWAIIFIISQFLCPAPKRDDKEKDPIDILRGM